MSPRLAALALFTVCLTACGAEEVPPSGSNADAGTPTDSGAAPGDAGLMPVEPMDGGSNAGDGGAPDADAGATGGGGSVDAGAPPPPVTPPADPGIVGPSSVSELSNLPAVVRGSRRTPVQVHLPASSAPAPLLVFVPGFQTSSSKYSGLASHLASHGFAVVRCEPPNSLFSADHAAMAADVRAVLDWALAANGPLAGKVDATRVGLFGHSLGGKVTTMAAADDARVKALFAMDPVNGGGGPLGYSASTPDVVPPLEGAGAVDKLTPLRIPVGFPGETTNGTSSSFIAPACAPTDQNFRTFYSAASNAPWAAAWEFAGADHLDFLDDGGGFACPSGTASQDDVRSALRLLATAFFRRHLLAETGMEPYLTGAQVPPIAAVAHRP